MQITKYEQSCLLVETNGRVALFDPGVMSEQALSIEDITSLDDIIITHSHADHMSLKLLQELVVKFPRVRITAPEDAVTTLKQQGITASSQPSEGISFFNAPHESVEPLFPLPNQIGVHYLDILSHPGDSHSFTETKAILALPVTAPWGMSTRAIKLAIELKPKYVLPIHDWQWRDEARAQMYGIFSTVLVKNGIIFLKPETGKPISIDV